jgi:TRAP-type C4-dicarboxylate transport system permease small subunit
MFRKAIHVLDYLLQKVTILFAVLAGLMTVFMIFVTTYGVVMRYFFRRPEPVSYELATILLIWGFLYAISYVELRGEHIRADIFVPLMPAGMIKFLHGIVAPILALIYCYVLTWKGWTNAMYSLSINEKSMSVWEEPLFPVKIMVPICYALLTLVVVRTLFKGIATYSKHVKDKGKTVAES